MCGIGGIVFKSRLHGQQTGAIAFRILQSIYRRGPNSTGVALWQDNDEGHTFVGVNVEEPAMGPKVIERLDELGAVKALSDGGGYIRSALAYRGKDAALVDAIDALGHGVTCASIGSHIEVLKHMGGVANLESHFKLSAYEGRVAIGLTRFATESAIDFTHAQPLSARGMRDLIVMHNGHITNYHRLRWLYENKRGYRFTTRNDSEILCAVIWHEMKEGASFKEALASTIDLVDGCFTYIAMHGNEVALVKDRYAAKPMVVAENDEFIAIASDAWAICEGVQREVEVFEPGAGTVLTWRLQ
jgi:glutamine phosphoribosylpyrophosphate amidotransferase